MMIGFTISENIDKSVNFLFWKQYVSNGRHYFKIITREEYNISTNNIL